MAKYVADLANDALLDYIAACTQLDVISDAALPTGGLVANATILATHVMAGGDFAKADGAVDGRKLTIAEQADIIITASGTALHVILSDGTTIRHMTSCTSQALVDNDSNTVTVPAYTHTVRDPT